MTGELIWKAVGERIRGAGDKSLPGYIPGTVRRLKWLRQ
jgi:hypothetical protein